MRTTAGPRAGARDLPPGRRRVPRPAALPPRLDARLPGPAQRGPRRQRHASPTRSATASPTTSCVYTYVPDLIRYYLRRGAGPRQRRHLAAGRARGAREEVLDRLDELVLKPVDGSGGKGIVIGPHASTGRARRRCAAKVLADPRGWIAQPVVQLSTVPTLIDGPDAPAPRRPAPVRGQRRRRGLGAARRPDPGRAARGRAGRELQPGRRLQGHLGARPAAAAAASAPAPAASAAPRRSAGVAARRRTAVEPARAGQQQQQQQHGTRRAAC